MSIDTGRFARVGGPDLSRPAASAPAIPPARRRALPAALPRGLLLLAAAGLFLTPLPARDLWAPDEPRYAQVAEELRSMGHGARSLVLLHLNGSAYTQKPPLYFWLAALIGAPLGRVSEAAARLPSALAGIGVVALAAGFGARLFGAAAGVLGAALLLTTLRFAELSQRAQLDAPLAFFELAGLILFWRIESGHGRRRANLAAMHGAMGLAVLTKGPVGFLVPSLVTAAYLAAEGRWRDLREYYPLWGLLLSVGPGLAWLAAATSLAPPGYFGDAVVTNLFGRFFAGTSHARPFYYYLFQFPPDLLPWLLLLPVAVAGWRSTLRRQPESSGRRAPRLLLLWTVVPFVFFSLSAGKRGLYLLPSIPAVMLLLAEGVRAFVEERGQLPSWLTRLALGLALLLIAATVAVAGGLYTPEGKVSIPSSFLLAVIVSLGLSFWVARSRLLSRDWRPLFACVAAVYALELSTFTLLFPALDPEKSPRPIARAAAAVTPPGEPIGLVSDEALTGGLVYYSGLPVRGLDSPEDVRAFAADGGRAIVVAEKKLERVTRALPVRVVARLRSGRRATLVVRPLATSGPARRAARDGDRLDPASAARETTLSSSAAPSGADAARGLP